MVITDDTPSLTVARRLVERGFSVIPIDHPTLSRETDPRRIGKIPLLKKWKPFQERRPTDEELCRWFDKSQPCNIGIVTGAISRIVVVDADSQEAQDWITMHLPETGMMTQTPRGRHLYFRHPGQNWRIANAARINTGDPLVLIDVRGDGGYVVAPGSLHAKGIHYQQLGPWPPVDDLPVFDPAWLKSLKELDNRVRQAVTDSNELLRRARAYIGRVPPAIEGQGGDAHTFSLCCKLVRGFNLGEAQTLELMMEAWNGRCAPPWTETELRTKIRNAMEYGEEPIGARAADPDRTNSLPEIDSGDFDLARVTARAVEALTLANEPPTLFRFGSTPVRLELDDAGTPLVRPLTEDRVRHHLARSATWFVLKKRHNEGEWKHQAALPPIHVARDILALPSPPFPVIERIVEAPVYCRSGRLCATRGYHADGRLFVTLAEDLEGISVLDRPTRQEVDRARNLILNELLGDFPFVSKAERAHAVACLLLPFVRDLIDGPTPLHLLEKPTPGTGASLLADMLLLPALGREVPIMCEGRDDDEWRKRLTAKLAGSPTVTFIDNLRRRLESSAVAAALTGSTWEDRVLGGSTMIRVPIRCVWLASANNPASSNEITRRTVRIRLDAGVERPWLRTGFKHTDLRTWARENRRRLVESTVTLVQNWIREDRPPGKQTMGQYEHWARTLGGILYTSGIEGFLTNLDDFYESAEDEERVWQVFVAAWAEKFRERTVGVQDLWNIITDAQAGIDGFDLGDKGDRSQRTRLGKLLASKRDRIFAKYRIVSAGTHQNAQRWNLRTVDHPQTPA